MIRKIVGFFALAMLAVPAHADTFSDHWHDGHAELCGYNLKVSRYGQTRDGSAVMIFVTEPFSEKHRVKVDDPSRNPSDTFDALKLNFVRDFQTGIYDYNTMVSVFVRSDTFEPKKVSFSSSEWCGHVYEELRFDPTKVTGNYFSYFEGESGAIDLQRPTGAISEDNLFILLRGLRGDYLGSGAEKSVKLLPGLFYSRLAHDKLGYVDAKISRRSHDEKVTVPAGTFSCKVYDVRAGDRSGVFFIEAAYPHRIVKWSLPPDQSGELTGSKRLKYWSLNRNGGESHLADIGLKP